MHENFVMWHHWHEVSETLRKDVALLEKIADQGLSSPAGSTDVGD